MINDVDEVLQELLIRDIPIKNGEVDIEFHQPRREWSARLNRPTLNLFLYDLHENTTLRQSEWQITRNPNGTMSKRRSPTRLDLQYLITAWATEPDDEHRLLTRTMMSLLRNPELPNDLLPPSLQNQPAPILVNVAQPDALRNAADIWGVLDNELRPALSCIVTFAVNPYAPITGPLVRTRDLRVGQAAGPTPAQKLMAGVEPDRFWMVGGALRTAEPLEALNMTLLERGQTIRVDAEGRFIIGDLEAGDYTLEISAEGRKPRRRKLTVPAPDYDIKL